MDWFARPAASAAISLAAFAFSLGQQQRFPCEAFRYNPNGSITANQSVTLRHPSGPVRIGRGTTFSHAPFMGNDMVHIFEDNCR